MSKAPIAFFSYVHDDDTHENGRLTRIRERLQGEISMQWGERVEIFQDRDMRWGTAWKERIENTLDATAFLIPVVTPRYFRSDPCREEFNRFLERERKLGRQDLILPFYYSRTPMLDKPELRAVDLIASVIAGRQYLDWRSLRFEPDTSPEFGKALARAAEQIVESLHQSVPTPSSAPASPPRSVPASRQDSETPPPDSGSGTATPGGPANGAAAAGAAFASPPADPPTLVVDAMHRGDCATISEAIAKANPGSRILLRPGTYREGLVIDKVLEIVGDGNRDDIVVEATGCDAVLFKATMGRVANLTLRQCGGGRFYGVDIAAGRLDLSDCDIVSDSLACIAIRNGADPRLRRNRVHDGKAGGIFIYENGRGTIEDNDISGNALAGIEIKEGGDPVIRRNRIHDGKKSGIHVWSNGRGTIEDNDISGNANSGIQIREDGDPLMRHNRIHDGKQGGIMVGHNGRGTIEDNDISGNALAGIEIKEGGDPVIRRNRIHDGKQGGIYVYENGRGTIEDNDISGNALAGIEVKEGGDPVIRRNRIHDGKQGGIYVHTNGRGTIEENELTGNANSGILVTKSSTPTVRRNLSADNGGYGICLLDSAVAGTYEGNRLSGNKKGSSFRSSTVSLDLVWRNNSEE